MKKLMISKLVLENFKGVKSLSLDFTGSATIYGRNEAGKTTVMDSVMWLFFNKDSHGSAKFSIKPLVNGSPESNLEHMVEGVFNDGEKNITLKKVYKETWTKKRGSLVKEFTGHTTKYYIDEVGTPAKKFNEAVAELTADADKFQLLSSPTFFSESLPWKKRRSMIVDLVGDISDEEVISSNPELKDVPEILDGKSVEDRMTVIAQGKKQVNKDIESIPGRIDEKMRSLPELTTANTEVIIKKLTVLNKDLSNINEKIAGIKAGGGAAETKTEIAKVDGDIQTIKSAFQKKQDEKTASKRDQLNALKDHKAESLRNLQDLEKKCSSLTADAGLIEEILSNLRAEFASISTSTFIEEACVTCGQALPKESVEKALATFNANKANAIELNRTTGKANADKLKDINSQLIELSAELAKAKSQDVDSEIEQLEKEIAETKFSGFQLEKDLAFIDANKMKGYLQQQLEDLEKDNSSLIEKETEVKTAIEEEIKEQNSILAQIEQHQKDSLRVNELKTEEQKLGKQYEQLEGQLFILESFIKAKVALLEGRVAEKFGSVGFKMFSPQINGGLTETCEATVNSVPYADLNNAAKVQSGVSIINTFAKHYEFTPFIFIDNRESVTDIPDTDAQVISLVVSPGDDVLRIEGVEESLKAAA